MFSEASSQKRKKESSLECRNVKKLAGHPERFMRNFVSQTQSRETDSPMGKGYPVIVNDRADHKETQRITRRSSRTTRILIVLDRIVARSISLRWSFCTPLTQVHTPISLSQYFIRNPRHRSVKY